MGGKRLPNNICNINFKLNDKNNGITEWIIKIVFFHYLTK